MTIEDGGDGMRAMPHGLTLAAHAQHRIYGIADPALTDSRGGLGLARGDNLLSDSRFGTIVVCTSGALVPPRPQAGLSSTSTP